MANTYQYLDVGFALVSNYTGRENDGNGIYYYRARYYSTTLGRFISQDPIGFRGGINAYAYVIPGRPWDTPPRLISSHQKPIENQKPLRARSVALRLSSPPKRKTGTAEVFRFA